MSKKGLMILVISFLIVAIAVGAGFFVLWGKISGTAPKQPAGIEEVAKKKDGKPIVKALLAMETFVVNLADPGGKRYLRVSMSLEINDQDFVEEVKKKIPHMRDSILMILPTKTFNDVRTSPGKETLRQEIITQLNSHLKEAKIVNLYFQEFVIQ